MRGTDARPELPLAATEPAGCSCCSTETTARPAPADEAASYSLEGLTCGHFVRSVEKAVGAVDGVESASMELVAGGTSRLSVSGTAAGMAIRDAVAAAGYSIS